jgi:hypothetical protein
MDREVKGVWPVIVAMFDPPRFFVAEELVEKPYASQLDVYPHDLAVGTPGKCRKDEDPVMAAIRESKEETGNKVIVKSNALTPLGIINVDTVGGFFPVKVFLALVSPQDIPIEDPKKWKSADGETQPYGWLSSDEIYTLNEQRRFRGGALIALELAEKALVQ